MTAWPPCYLKQKFTLSGVLDHCYLYPTEGNVFEDAPGILIGMHGKPEIEVLDHGKSRWATLVQAHREQKNRTYLMFKPEGENSEWIPLKVVRWTWSSGIIGFNDWGKKGEKWEVSNSRVIPKNPEAEDASRYPKWAEGKNAGNRALYE